MDYKELSLAIKLCGSKTHIRECKECPYFEGDYSGDCVTKMTQDASKAIEDLLERAEKAETISSELCDDFIDFVTSGVYNAASYCANMRKECINAYGICDGNNEVCKGFLPKAVILREE